MIAELLPGMLVIRLQRVGRRNQASFRVIVTPKRASPRGKVVELLGNWNPRLDQVSLKKERILYWLSKGAKASPTLHNLLVREKVIEGKKIPKHKKAKQPEEAIPTAAETAVPATLREAEAPAETAPETSAAETTEAQAETKPEENL